jgi:hypothetical protein
MLPDRASLGQKVKALFTVSGAVRYAVAAMLLVAAAIAVSVPHLPHQLAAPAVQATATVRILQGARLHLGEHRGHDGYIARDAVFRIGGSIQPAKLIEFE